MTSKKYFSVEEANRRLPLVKPIVADIVEQFRVVEDLRERLAATRRPHRTTSLNDAYTEELAVSRAQLEEEESKLHGYLAELSDLGIEFKDPRKGLVDFPSIVEGREVLLCWMLGEPEVAYWHEADAGFAGRQSLMAASLPSKGENGQNDDV